MFNYLKAENKVRPLLKTQEKDFHVTHTYLIMIICWWLETYEFGNWTTEKRENSEKEKAWVSKS